MNDPSKLDFVKIVRAKGRQYVYFVQGRSASGEAILIRLPDFDHPEFNAVYQECLRQRPGTEMSLSERIEASKNRAVQRVAAAQAAPGKVYFIAAQSGEIKIGHSRTPKARLVRLQTGHPDRLTLLATVDGGVDLEREYHNRFSGHRIKGEWFHPHRDIWAEIVRINHG